MNFQSLNYFIMLAREKNFTRAAEKLHLTQQTLSANVAALEKEWGMKFLIRHVPLELTDAGKVFYAYALQFTRGEEALFRTLKDIANEEAGNLTIGVGFVRERDLLPTLIASFVRNIPKSPLIWWKEAMKASRNNCRRETSISPSPISRRLRPASM